MKIRKIALSVVLCSTLLVTSGCSVGDKISSLTQKEKKNSDYVTLGEYKEVSLKTSDIDDQVQSQIDETLDNYATYKKKKSGKVKDGDTVNIYYVGKLNGKKFDGGSCTKKDTPEGYDLTIGSNTFISGFEDGLIGASVGDTVDVKTTFPDTYSNNPDLAGKKVVFTVTINYIQGKKVLPELTDKFVKKNLTSYKSVKDYKSTLRQKALEDLSWDAVYNASTVNDYPEDEVDSMYNQLYTSITYYLSQNSYTLSDYLSAQNTTSEDFKSQLQDTAKEDVGKQLIYRSIAELQDITVSDDEYEEELNDYLSSYNCEDEDALNETFQNYYGTDAKEMITDDLLYKKVKTYLAGNVVES
jgi:trigger factor